MKPDLLAEIDCATRAYCAQARALTLTPTDFHDWLASLPPARQAEARQRGFRASRADPEFIRCCLEWRGIDLWSFMAATLSLPAFEFWTTTGQGVRSWPRKPIEVSRKSGGRRAHFA